MKPNDPKFKQLIGGWDIEDLRGELPKWVQLEYSRIWHERSRTDAERKDDMYETPREGPYDPDIAILVTIIAHLCALFLGQKEQAALEHKEEQK